MATTFPNKNSDGRLNQPKISMSTLNQKDKVKSEKSFQDLVQHMNDILTGEMGVTPLDTLRDVPVEIQELRLEFQDSLITNFQIEDTQTLENIETHALEYENYLVEAHAIQFKIGGYEKKLSDVEDDIKKGNTQGKDVSDLQERKKLIEGLISNGKQDLNNANKLANEKKSMIKEDFPHVPSLSDEDFDDLVSPIRDIAAKKTQVSDANRQLPLINSTIDFGNMMLASLNRDVEMYKLNIDEINSRDKASQLIKDISNAKNHAPKDAHRAFDTILEQLHPIKDGWTNYDPILHGGEGIDKQSASVTLKLPDIIALTDAGLFPELKEKITYTADQFKNEMIDALSVDRKVLNDKNTDFPYQIEMRNQQTAIFDQSIEIIRRLQLSDFESIDEFKQEINSIRSSNYESYTSLKETHDQFEEQTQEKIQDFQNNFNNTFKEYQSLFTSDIDSKLINSILDPKKITSHACSNIKFGEEINNILPEQNEMDKKLKEVQSVISTHNKGAHKNILEKLEEEIERYKSYKDKDGTSRKEKYDLISTALNDINNLMDKPPYECAALVANRVTQLQKDVKAANKKTLKGKTAQASHDLLSNFKGSENLTKQAKTMTTLFNLRNESVDIFNDIKKTTQKIDASKTQPDTNPHQEKPR